MNDNIKYLEEAIRRVDIEGKQHFQTWSEASNKAEVAKAYSQIGAFVSILCVVALLSYFLFDTYLGEYIPAIGLVSIIVFFYYSSVKKYQGGVAFWARNSWEGKRKEKERYENELEEGLKKEANI